MRIPLRVWHRTTGTLYSSSFGGLEAILVLVVLLHVADNTVKAQEQSSPIDLYVKHRYDVFGTTAIANNETCPTGQCVDDNDSACQAEQSLHLQGYCEPYAFDNRILYAGNATASCQRALETTAACYEASQNLTTNDDSSATSLQEHCPFGSTPFGTCQTTSGGQVMTNLLAWCIQSNVPINDYTIPLAAVYEYESFQDCVVALTDFSHDRVRTRFRWIVNDPHLCVPAPVLVSSNDDSETTYVKGSMRMYCNSDTLVTHLYTNRNCNDDDDDDDDDENAQKYDDNALGPWREPADQCNPRLLTGAWVRSSCSNEPPQYHCKTLYDTTVGTYVGPTTVAPTTMPKRADTTTIAPLPPSSSASRYAVFLEGWMSVGFFMMLVVH